MKIVASRFNFQGDLCNDTLKWKSLECLTKNIVLLYRAKPKKGGAAPAWCNFALEQTAMPEEISKSPYQASNFCSPAEANAEAPEADFTIEHVYGYRASDCQQNL